MNQLLSGLLIVIASLLLSRESYSQISFITHILDNHIHGTGGLYGCDIDQDGDMDILAASLEDHQIVWYRNDVGDTITWTKIIIGTNIYNAHSVYAADFDRDGDSDIVGCAYYGSPGIAWWRNEGGDSITWTKFPVAPNFINAHEVSVCDLDRDGDPDILGVSSDSNKVSWWRNDGGNPIVWTEQMLSNTSLMAKSVTAGDLDNDDNMDVVAASIYDHDVAWWKNNGGNPITWYKYLISGNFTGAHRAQIVDIDMDSVPDVLGAGYTGHHIAWFKNNGVNPWPKYTIASGFTNACVAFAADLDNDGDPDVTGTSQGLNKVIIWINQNGHPVQWTPITLDSSFTRPWPLFVCDIDGDHDLDVVAGSSHNGNNQIRWYENRLPTNTIHDKEVKTDKRFNLKQNYPNPFNPGTTIEFEILKPGFVSLKIFNMLGQEISELVSAYLPFGVHKIYWNRNGLASGVYFYRLTYNGQSITRKLVIMS